MHFLLLMYANGMPIKRVLLSVGNQSSSTFLSLHLQNQFNERNIMESFNMESAPEVKGSIRTLPNCTWETSHQTSEGDKVMSCGGGTAAPQFCTRFIAVTDDKWNHYVTSFTGDLREWAREIPLGPTPTPSLVL